MRPSSAGGAAGWQACPPPPPRLLSAPRASQSRAESQLRARRALAAGSSAGAAGAANHPGRRLLQRQPWFDTSKTVDQRVEALLNSMTLAQMKVQMESTDAGAIPSLGVSAFKYQARAFACTRKQAETVQACSAAAAERCAVLAPGKH